MNEKLRNPNNDYFFKCVLSLKNLEECYDFFDDICTASEIQDMGKRMCAAKMLSEGKQYTEIIAATGLSTATVSRVNRCLKYGSDGYKIVLDRNEK